MAKLLQKSIAFDTLIVSEVFIKMNWDVNAKELEINNFRILGLQSGISYDTILA